LRYKTKFVNQLEQIKQPVREDLIRFGQLFDQTLQHSNPLLNSVFDHIRQRKGKQMRPTLLLLTAREFGLPTEASYLSAVMLELLHTASLVHDDIVDESDERRGQASVNASYGNKVAVLVGDYLLSSSLEKAAETRNLRIVDHISKLGKQLSSGEIIQLSNTDASDFSEQTYYDVIKLKTATLFAETAELGAISVGAAEQNVERMHQFGESLGMCFQIRDDIFDYYDGMQIGKPTGNDMAEGKLTLPALYVLNTCPTDEMTLIGRRVKALKASHEEILKLVEYTKAKGGIDFAYARMHEFSEKALSLIADFRNDAVKQALILYVDYVSRRTI
jgi:octaprenyl-diphosphate synthase